MIFLMMISMIQKTLLLMMLSWSVSFSSVSKNVFEAAIGIFLVIEVHICKLCLLLALQDEYFEVDNSAIRHDGFFVNRGKLERM